MQRPDGTIIVGAVKEGASTKVEKLNLASPFCGTVNEEAALQKASIWVWEGDDPSVDDTPPEELYPLVYTPDKPPTGATPLDVSSDGFMAQTQGYKFKVDHLVYAREYGVSGMLLDVQKPDGTSQMTQVIKQ